MAQRGDSDRLLEQVLKSNQSLRCRGIRVVVFRFVRDGKPGTRKFSELIVRDGDKNRTEYIGEGRGSGQIAVDDGKWRLEYVPEQNVINKMLSLTKQNNERLDILMKSSRSDYGVSVKEGGRVADYPTLLITMKNEQGFEHKLWVERRGKAILKREFNGPDPNRGVSYEFQQFRYLRSTDPSDFMIDKPGAKVIEPIDRLNSAAAKYGMSPRRIVGGEFVLSDASGFDFDGTKVVRSTYGDGKKVLTLVQVLGDIDESRLSRGDSRLNSHVWTDGGYKFALIGDFPKDELKRLSGLVRR